MADQREYPRPQRKASGGGSTIVGTKKRHHTIGTADDRNKMSNVKLSKSLSWVLRHSAHSLGLKLAPDGFVPVEDVLSLNHPRFRNQNGQPKYTVEDVVLVVQNNDKQRFRLEHKDVSRGDSASSEATIENDRKDDKVLCIRANQGHSLKGLRPDQLLTPLTEAELSGPNSSIIHGTTRKAWEDHIQHEGLSRMRRNHIHFATGLPPSPAAKMQKHQNKNNGTTPISGMRSSSEIYIYVDGPRCADDGIPFYCSVNGVILSAGVNEEGMLPVKYFEKVVYAFSGKVLWKPDAGRQDNCLRSIVE